VAISFSCIGINWSTYFSLLMQYRELLEITSLRS